MSIWIIRAAIVALTLPLSAFAAGAPPFVRPPHPVCKDEATTDTYAKRWRDDLAAAIHAGTVTAEAGKAATQEMTDAADGITSRADLSPFCYKLDELRAKYGF